MKIEGKLQINTVTFLQYPAKIMPKHHFSTRKLRGHKRTKVTMQRGEVISLCRCWQSKNFPLSDRSHKDLDDEKGPVVIYTDCDKNFLKSKED